MTGIIWISAWKKTKQNYIYSCLFKTKHRSQQDTSFTLHKLFHLILCVQETSPQQVVITCYRNTHQHQHHWGIPQQKQTRLTEGVFCFTLGCHHLRSGPQESFTPGVLPAVHFCSKLEYHDLWHCSTYSCCNNLWHHLAYS